NGGVRLKLQWNTTDYYLWPQVGEGRVFGAVAALSKNFEHGLSDRLLHLDSNAHGRMGHAGHVAVLLFFLVRAAVRPQAIVAWQHQPGALLDDHRAGFKMDAAQMARPAVAEPGLVGEVGKCGRHAGSVDA